MSDVKKDHSFGTGTGAAAGAVAGAVVGAVGGPIGIAAGAVIGGVLGAGAGDSLAEAVNPTVYADYWKSRYEAAPYYVTGRAWSDYEPAYMLGSRAYASHSGRSFDEVESDLAREWDASRGTSRLDWLEAKAATRDGWQYIEGTTPVGKRHVI